MTKKYKVYYKNENVKTEKWLYVITADNRLDAKWKGIIKAENEGHLAGWLEVYCEQTEGEQ